MRARVAVILALAALSLGGCGVGAEDAKDGSATLTVTRDFGAQRLLEGREGPIPGGDTVMRFLSRKADVETRYGGRFVNAIEGLRSRGGGGAQEDWFYFVNGIEADKGAAEVEVNGGDRVWWDYRDWSAAMRVPAVVGSFPEPFVHGSEGKRFPVRLDCASEAQDQCSAVRARLERAGVETAVSALGTPAGKDTLRVVVGRWADVRADGAVRELEQGPQKSGVFARIEAAGGGYELELLDERGRTARTLGAGAGIVAATRFEDQQPTWIVSGTDEAGVDRAVALVERPALRDRFAVAASGAGPQSLPVSGGGG